MKGSYHFETMFFFSNLNPQRKITLLKILLFCLDSPLRATNNPPFEQNSFHLIRALNEKIFAMPSQKKTTPRSFVSLVEAKKATSETEEEKNSRKKISFCVVKKRFFSYQSEVKKGKSLTLLALLYPS